MTLEPVDDLVTPAARRGSDRKPGTRWVAAALATALATLGGCGGDGGADAEAGPLSFVDGTLEEMMYPMPGRVFFSLHGCLRDRGAAEVHLVSAEPVKLRGAHRVGFRAAWTAPDESLRVGAGPIRMMEPQYGRLPGTSGEVRPCGGSEFSSGLDIAVVLPEAARHGVVVDGLRLSYEIDGQPHLTRIDAVLGICPQDPIDVAREDEACRVDTKATDERSEHP